MCERHRCRSACTANADRSAPLSFTEYRMSVCFAPPCINHLAHADTGELKQKMQPFAF